MSDGVLQYDAYDETKFGEDEQADKAQSGRRFRYPYRWEEGLTGFRVLPPKKGSGKRWYATAFQHRRVTAPMLVEALGLKGDEAADMTAKLEGKFRFGVDFFCPRKMGDAPCELCQHSFKLSDAAEASGNDEDKKAASRFRPWTRYRANIVVRGREGDGVQLLELSKENYEALREMGKNPKLGGNFLDPTDKGFDLVMNRVGKRKDTTYKIVPDRNSSALSDDVQQAAGWIDGQPDLDAECKADPIRDVLERITRAKGERPAGSPSSRSRVGKTVGDDIGGGLPEDDDNIPF